LGLPRWRPTRFLLDLQTQEHRVELRFQVGLIEVVIGAFVQGAQDQFGLRSHSDGKDGTGDLSANFPQQVQGALGERRQDDHQHVHSAARQDLFGVLERNEDRTRTVQAGL
jgi:hypothetical protein